MENMIALIGLIGMVGFMFATMGMDYSFKEFVRIVPYFIEAKIPILMRGGHGKGKSSLVFQLGEKLSKEHYKGISDWPVFDKRWSQLTEGDTIGLPDREALCGDVRVTNFNPPKWFYLACIRPVILLLDEIDRAVLEVAQSGFQLLDSRKMGDYELHPDTIVIGAINGGTHQGADNYSVRAMDPAEIDRWAIFDVNPTPEDWFDWARGKIHPVLIEFLSEHPALLERNGDMEANKKYPSRRSWERVSNALGALLDNPAENAGDVLLIANAIVGADAAQVLAAKCKEIKKDLNAVEVLVDGKRLEKGLENVQYMKVLDGMQEVFDRLANMESDCADKKECRKLRQVFYDNLAEFLGVVPREIGTKVVKLVMQTCMMGVFEGNAEKKWKFPEAWRYITTVVNEDKRYYGGSLGNYFLPMEGEVEEENKEE